MHTFKALRKKLYGSKNPCHGSESKQQVAASHAPTEKETLAANHRTPPPLQSNPHYGHPRWTDSAAAADYVAAEDGPSHMANNMNVQEIDSATSHNEVSVYFVSSGRIQQAQAPAAATETASSSSQLHSVHNTTSNDTTTAPSTVASASPEATAYPQPKRYKPPLFGDSDDSDDDYDDYDAWRAGAARSHTTAAELGRLGDAHRHERAHLQTRLSRPQQALMATFQRAQVDMRALERENDAIMDGIQMVRRQADMLQGDLAMCRVRNEQFRTAMDELSAELDRRRLDLDREKMAIEADLEQRRQQRRRRLQNQQQH